MTIKRKGAELARQQMVEVNRLELKLHSAQLQLFRRKNVVLSQGLTALLSVFWQKLLSCLRTDPEELNQLVKVGFLVQIESLLSTIRNEREMLLDFSWCT